MHDRFIAVQGYRLRYIEAGRGPLALLLHGFAGSADDWRPTAEILARAGYRALAIDCLGFGMSDKPGDAPYSLTLIAGLYAEALGRLGAAPAAVVAHSMGGKYALALALLHPRLVRGLALIASDGFAAASPLTRLGGWPLVGAGLIWLSARPPLVRAMLSAAFYAPGGYVTDQLIQRARAAFLGPANRRALTALSRRYDATDLAISGLRARLGELRAPTLLAWGEDDRIFPLSQGRVAAAEIPAARLLTFPRCGHFPQVEAARPLHGALLGFLAGLSA
jgi:pimeloyl-ACP methyl ester carboxylesterase